MPSLIEDLQSPKDNLRDFAQVAKRVLDYLPDVISERAEVRGYTISFSVTAGTTKFVRPINNSMFITDASKLEEQFERFITVLHAAKGDRSALDENSYRVVDTVVYTMQQSIGVGLDLLSNPNSARKHVGNRFEELIRAILAELDISHKKIVFKIPYPTEEGPKQYSCETDVIISPFDEVRSETHTIVEREVVISTKTTTKDRMGKIFLDKLLMERFAGHPVRVVGIFLNDVQRKESSNISYTFVSGLFMVYSTFLTKLDGAYFVDPPPKAQETPYNQYVSRFSKFVIDDVWELLSS